MNFYGRGVFDNTIYGSIGTSSAAAHFTGLTSSSCRL
jgi:hypothetical protein